MDPKNNVHQLLDEANIYHKELIAHARAVSKLRDFIQFIADCIDFANRNFPGEITQEWIDNNEVIPVLAGRSRSIFVSRNPDSVLTSAACSTGSTGSTVTFSFITSNYNFIESKDDRLEYLDLTKRYSDLTNSEEHQQLVYDYLTPIHQEAADKYIQGINEFQSLPMDEDPQGPLMALRSAIDLVLKNLIDQLPLTNEEKKLKKVSQLPIIAEYLAKDEAAKIDLILANEQLQVLRGQLSASKNKKLPRDVAESLVSQATALLNLLATTVIPGKDKSSEEILRNNDQGDGVGKNT